MKKFVLALLLLFSLGIVSQNNLSSNGKQLQPQAYLDSLKGFSMDEMNHHLEHFKGTLNERNARIALSKRAYINRKYKLGSYGAPKANANRNLGNQSTDAVSCTNIGFESGNTSGWTITGDNALTSGAALDAFGNYPKVFAGNYSLQLSSNNTGTSNFTSSATRVISVPAGNSSFFKLNFAL
ncbi:MAG: hypothetical protein ABI448_00695, partial [Bacteroidia bacterium]